jgi:Flp pilus assembly pilin Flp
MQALKWMVRHLARDERGLETVEYAVVAALISGSAVLAMTSLGTNVAAKFGILVMALQ